MVFCFAMKPKSISGIVLVGTAQEELGITSHMVEMGLHQFNFTVGIFITQCLLNFTKEFTLFLCERLFDGPDFLRGEQAVNGEFAFGYKVGHMTFYG